MQVFFTIVSEIIAYYLYGKGRQHRTRIDHAPRVT